MAYKKQKNVNIDALIAREDFEAADETTNTASKISTLSVNDLKEGSGLFLASVRKPDFQRETADWDIDKIVRFIKSFVDGEFIPAVILWRSQAGLIFVIDGYSNKGNFRPASFYGAIEFIRTLDTNPAILKSFIEQRKNFEDFIFENDIAVQRIIDTYRRGLQSARHISDY